MYRKIGQTTLILMLCMGINAFAGETLASDTVYTLGEVVVTEPEAKGVETIATMHQITAKEIEMRGAKTLDKAIELLPGLDVRRGAQGIPRVNLRGMRSRHVILLLNGIPFNSTYDAQFDPATISTENIAKIKVTYGNNSVLYGQGGLGGVINIITKKGTKKVSGGVSAEITERGDYASRADVSGGSDKLDFFVSGSRQDSDGFRMSDDFDEDVNENGGIRENSDAEQNNFYANLGFSPDEELRFGLMVGGNQGEYGRPPEIDSPAKKTDYERIDDYNGQFGQFSVGYDPKGIFELRAWGYISKSEQDLITYTNADYDTIDSEQKDETEIYGGTVQSSFTTKQFGKLSFSLNGQNDQYEDTETTDSSHEIDLFSAAAEYEITLFERLGVVAGYSHHWQNKDEGNDDDQGSWLFGLTYDAFKNTRLRTSYAHKIRFASIKNLYATKGGNPDLTTEDSDNFEFGVTQLLPFGIMADLAIFRNEVDNYIAKDSKKTFQNNDEYCFKGVELSLSKSFSKASLSLGYSWMDAVDKSEGSTEDDLEYRPKHKITLQGNYAFDFGLTAYASVMQVMDQIYYDGATKEEISDYVLVDVKLEQRVFKNNCFVYIGADNLFDEDYEESDGYPQAGRTAYAGVRFRF